MVRQGRGIDGIEGTPWVACACSACATLAYSPPARLHLQSPACHAPPPPPPHSAPLALQAPRPHSRCCPDSWWGTAPAWQAPAEGDAEDAAGVITPGWLAHARSPDLLRSSSPILPQSSRVGASAHQGPTLAEHLQMLSLCSVPACMSPAVLQDWGRPVQPRWPAALRSTHMCRTQPRTWCAGRSAAAANCRIAARLSSALCCGSALALCAAPRPSSAAPASARPATLLSARTVAGAAMQTPAGATATSPAARRRSRRLPTRGRRWRSVMTPAWRRSWVR